MTSGAPADPRRRAFAESLGHLVAELVWRDITDTKDEANAAGATAPERENAPPALVGVDPTGREVNHEKCITTSES